MLKEEYSGAGASEPNTARHFCVFGNDILESKREWATRWKHCSAALHSNHRPVPNHLTEAVIFRIPAVD